MQTHEKTILLKISSLPQKRKNGILKPEHKNVRLKKNSMVRSNGRLGSIPSNRFPYGAKNGLKTDKKRMQ
jgi:hypothetical protein